MLWVSEPSWNSLGWDFTLGVLRHPLESREVVVTAGLGSHLLSLQPPKGADRAPSTCGAGARHGQAGAASLCCLWSSWPGCSGHPPIWLTFHSAPVLVSLPTPLVGISPLPIPTRPHLRSPLVLADKNLVLCGDEEGSVWIYDVEHLLKQRPPLATTLQAPTQVLLGTLHTLPDTLGLLFGRQEPSAFFFPLRS